MRSLTLDDIFEFSERGGNPRTAAAELLDAVERGQLVDQSDAAPAFVVAGRLLADAGELATALTLAEKGVKASRAHDVEEWGPRAFRADVLLKLGRTSEGMAELSELRPYLTDDQYSVAVVGGVLEKHDRAALAVDWLTEALAQVLQRHSALSHLNASGSEGDLALGSSLMQERFRLRRALDLPVDEYDQTYAELTGALFEYMADADHLWYPNALFGQQDYERVLARWPEIAEEYGETWDDYRGHLQRQMEVAHAEGVSRPELVPTTFDDLVAFVGPDERLTPDVLDDYADSVADSTATIKWPPGRNDTCWCGSSAKYKKCCLPRSRS